MEVYKLESTYTPIHGDTPAAFPAQSLLQM